MSPSLVILLIIFYLAILFVLAFYFDQQAAKGTSILKNPWIYALSLPVYCTAWTYFGSVGKAAKDGIEFITIYLGPILMMPLWWIIVRKIIRICHVQRMSTLADFIAARYNNSVFVSVLVSILAIIGIIPYISIQLKSIVTSFDILVYNAHLGYSELPEKIFFTDTSFYLTIILAVFIILFAFRTTDTTDKHHGMVGAIAFESVFKLLAFLVVGSYITFSVFDGFGDVFSRASTQVIGTYSGIKSSGLEWMIMILLSMSAIFLLPRQFQVAVAENYSEQHIKKAVWVFPLYLLLINLFVIPIAIGGQLLLKNQVDPDSYVLALPLLFDQSALAILTFLGGFSAATGMIIVSTIALSLMVSNNIVVPLTLKQMDRKMMNHQFPLNTRRIAVFVILLLSYLYYVYISDRFSLVSIGLISFAAIIQFAPAVIGALFWKDATRKGAILGMIIGFSIWIYTLIVPTMIETGLLTSDLIRTGIFSIDAFKPQQLFGLQLDPVVQGTLWSLVFNVLFFVFGSLWTEQSAKERNMAELYVDIFSHSASADEKVIWKGKLLFNDLKMLLINLLGEEKTAQRIIFFESHYGKPVDDQNEINPRFVNYSERLLSGLVGAASARLLISSLSKEEEIELSDVVKILKESTEISRLNKELTAKSRELEARTNELTSANEKLKFLDAEKDDFISTVTHEMRTPLTSIKAMVEIIQDNPEMTVAQKTEFLNTVIDQIDRMARLINQVLDLEKLETGQTHLDVELINICQLIKETNQILSPLANEKHIEIRQNLTRNLIIFEGDEERIRLVLTNLVSNAIKSIEHQEGIIEIDCELEASNISVSIRDNGKGIDADSIHHIFDKFFQARDQGRKKPKGTGLGLSITKKIIELHGGQISVDSQVGKGSVFRFSLPLTKPKPAK